MALVEFRGEIKSRYGLSRV